MSNENTNYSQLNRIADALVDSQDKVENASRALLIALYPEDINFGAQSISHVFSDPKQKNARLDETYSAISPKYDQLLHKIALLLDKKEHDKKKFAADDKFTLSLLQAKQRSHRIHIERVLKALYCVRNGFPLNDDTIVTVTDVQAPKNKSHVIIEYVKGKTAKGADKYGDAETSMAVLIREGDKAMRADGTLPKKVSSSSSSARNPNADALSNAAKSLAAIAPTLTKPVENGKVNGAGHENRYENLSEENAAYMETIFKSVFVAKFFDGNVFDRKTFDGWLNEAFKAEKEAAAKTNEGAEKLVADEKARKAS